MPHVANLLLSIAPLAGAVWVSLLLPVPTFIASAGAGRVPAHIDRLRGDGGDTADADPAR